MNDKLESEYLRPLITRVQEEVGLPSHFIGLLALEDDWSMVIKLTALLEAALSVAIRKMIGREALSAFIDGLPVRGDRGKIGLAKLLTVLDKGMADYLDELYRMRNSFVHDPKNAGMTVFDFLRNLDSERRLIAQRRLFFAAKKERFKNFPADKQPKLKVWLSSMPVILRLAEVDSPASRPDSTI